MDVYLEERNKPLSRCPVTATLELIGGKYKAHILWHLTEKTLRFSELRKVIPVATPKMLTQSLRELEIDGLVSRKVYAVVPPKTEYSLTQKGRLIRPILDAIFNFGTGYLKENGVKPCCTMTTAHTCKNCF